MAIKEIKSRIVHKHDIEANWNKAINFTPQQGEIIVYDIDETHDVERFKIGDGKTLAKDLPFYSSAKPDWNQNDESKSDYIQNRTHYSIPSIDITWDGVMGDRVSLYLYSLGFGESYFVKVSDEVFTPEQLVGSQIVDTTGEITMVTEDTIDSTSFPGAHLIKKDVNFWYVASVYDVDELKTYLNSAFGYNLTNGTYFLLFGDFNITSLTKEGYLRQLDEQFIPDTIARTDYVNENFVLKSDLDSVKPDWNQNDENAPDYIKNRTHWIGDPVETVFVAEQTVNIDVAPFGFTQLNSSVTFTENETYIVTFDNVTYECVAQSFESHGVLGNMGLVGMGEDTGEPFFIDSTGDLLLVASNHGKHTLSISDLITEQTIVIFNAEYAELMGTLDLVLGETYTVTYNNTNYECIAKYCEESDCIYLGNGNIIMEETEDIEPFVICNYSGFYYELIVCTSGQHTIFVSAMVPEINKIDEKYLPRQLVGKNVTGEFYTINDEEVKASFGAEIFNNYDNNIASGSYSHAEGNSTTASGDWSHAEGYLTTASGESSHAEGRNTTASGDRSHAEGESTTASGNWAHAEGDNTIASGDWSHAEGVNTTASGSYSHAEGCYTKATATDDEVKKSTDNKKGFCTHAEGYGTVAYGPFSHAEGHATKASALASHAEGYLTTASGSYSHAEGSRATASGNFSHAEGGHTTASDVNSHAEGYNTTASGSYSHAEGNRAKASGSSSHAEGRGATASGVASHAEGDNTIASGNYSHAEGDNTIASGNYSHAEGSYTTANSKSQHTQGEWNILDTATDIMTKGTYAHIVGNGSSDYARSNAHTLDWDGNAWFAGDVYVGSTSGVNKDEGSKKLATEEYVDSKPSSRIIIKEW